MEAPRRETKEMRIFRKYMRSHINAMRGHGASGAFEKFTGRARNALRLAQEEARRLNHHYMGTEHILLGLIMEEDGIAGRALRSLGVDLGKARSAVLLIIGMGERPTLGEIGLTPRAKRVIELSVGEARRLGHRYIGTEHLLLGLVSEGSGIGAEVLKSLGVTTGRVRSAVESELAGGPK